MSGKISDNLGRSSGLVKAAGGGAILKTSTLQFTGVASHTGTAPVAMTEFNLSFAPTTSSGKLWLECHLMTSCGSAMSSAGYFYNSTDSATVGPIGAAAGSRLRGQWRTAITDSSFAQNVSFGCWYEPASTSSKDYQIFGAAQASVTFYINSAGIGTDNNQIYFTRCASTFSITEFDGSIVTIETT